LKGCPKGWPFIFIRTASDVKKKQDKSLKKKVKSLKCLLVKAGSFFCQLLLKTLSLREIKADKFTCAKKFSNKSCKSLIINNYI